MEQSDLDDAKTPWKMRYSAMQNVTINLPSIAYEAHQDDNRLIDILRERIDIVAQAHVQKKEFIGKLLAMGKDGPLSLLTMELDGEPYYRFNKASFLIGMVGLNELVAYHTGHQMHESKDSLKFGLKVIAEMKKESETLGEQYGIKMPLEQTPAESTAYRFARAGHEVLSAAGADRHPRQQEQRRGVLHQLHLPERGSADERHREDQAGRPVPPPIDAGSLTHIWLGEHKPPAESIAAFVKKTFETTQNAQIAFSPEFTSCISCGRTTRGLRDTCMYCGSPNVEGITRVTGFFSKTNSWNKGKLGELKDRVRNQI